MLTDNPNVPLILLVEDDDNHAGLMKASLQNAPEEYRLLIVGTLNDARTIIERQRPNLVLADFRLPDGDGSELVATVNKRCPVVLMTSQGNVQAAVDAMKNGVLDYVVKTSVGFAGMSRIVQRSLREWSLIQEQKLAEIVLKEKSTELEHIIRKVTHDLKNPLCVINANTWMIIKDIGTGNQARVEVAIKKIEEAVSRMTCQINDLLELTRSGRIKQTSQVDSKMSVFD